MEPQTLKHFCSKLWNEKSAIVSPINTSPVCQVEVFFLLFYDNTKWRRIWFPCFLRQNCKKGVVNLFSCSRHAHRSCFLLPRARVKRVSLFKSSMFCVWRTSGTSPIITLVTRSRHQVKVRRKIVISRYGIYGNMKRLSGEESQRKIISFTNNFASAVTQHNCTMFIGVSLVQILANKNYICNIKKQEQLM